MRNTSRIVIFLVAVLGAHGESGGIGGILSGVVFDAPSRSLRPVVGVPGAAYLGQPIARGFEAVSVAPDGRQAIALAQERLYWVGDVFEGAPLHELAQNAGRWELAAWRGDSSQVALWLGDRLMLASPDGLVSLPLDGLEAPIRALAVTDDGAVLAGVVGAGLYLLEPGAAPALVASLADSAGIAVAGDRAWVADRASRQVLEIRRYRETPEVIVFAGAGRGVADPIAVAVSRRGPALWIADAGGRKLARFDLATGAPLTEVTLDFEPSRLEALGGAGFLLNDRTGEGEAVEVLVEDEAAPSVYFVPAPAVGEE